MPVATVITGADRRYAPLLRNFAQGLLHTDDFDLIQYPGAEAALARTAKRGYGSSEAQYAVRDIIHTAAHLSHHCGGSKLCVLIGAVACNRGSAGYGECIRFVLGESEEVRDWKLFQEIFLACFTPDRSVVPISAYSCARDGA